MKDKRQRGWLKVSVGRSPPILVKSSQGENYRVQIQSESRGEAPLDIGKRPLDGVGKEWRHQMELI